MSILNIYLEQLFNPLINNFEVRPSPIHGDGAFSKVSLKKGDFVNTHMRPGTKITRFGRYLNHSYDPNALSQKKADGSYLVIAIKDIQPGVEITLDYTKNQELEQPQEGWK